MRRLRPRGKAESEDQHQRNARRTTPVSRSKALVATLVLLSAVSVILERRAQSYYSWIVPGISTRHGTMDIPPTRRNEEASRGSKEYCYARRAVASEYLNGGIAPSAADGGSSEEHLAETINPMDVADSGGHDEFEDAHPVDDPVDELHDNMGDFPVDENGEFVGIPAVDPNCKKGDPGCIKREADNGGG